MTRKTGWKKIGTCAVDSGQMMLVDPCYVLPDSKGDMSGVAYDELLELWRIQDWEGDFLDVKGLGYVSNTGYGDGRYNVYIKKADDKVAELKIVFIEEEDTW